MTASRLSPMSLGLSLGIIWGGMVFLMGLLAHFFEYGTAFVSSMGIIYIGYEPSILGSAIGGLMGFIDALIIGLLLASLYNAFLKCCCKK
jgi:hypothetical protein